MWLTSSSIGRKFIMSITGACLILFLTFHCLMNGVAIFWPQAYNVICELLGANWYALVASAGLAALFILHIVYAIWLTLQNRHARGDDRYKVVRKPNGVEWSSQNMLVLGFVVLAFLVLHLIQFWSKMQLAEIRHTFTIVEGVKAAPAAGTLFLQANFSQIWVTVVYVIAFIALWFHMTHGFWSMFQTAGWNNDIWIGRLKCIGNWWSTIVVALFIAEAVVFTCMAKCEDRPYLNCPELNSQYEEFIEEFVSADGAKCMLDKAECPDARMECPEHKGDCKHHKGDCKHHEGDCKHHEGCPEHKGECNGPKECAHEHECDHPSQCPHAGEMK